MARTTRKRRPAGNLPAVRSSRRRGLRDALRRIPSGWLRAGGALAALLLVLGGSATALYRSDLLRVQHVRVHGANAVEAEAVADAADIMGDSLLTLDTRAAERRIRAALPDVRSASVERRWLRGAAITVQEREPWAIWQGGASRYVIDEEGVVLHHGQPPAGAVTVRQEDGGDLRPGDTVDADALHLARRVLEATPEGVRIAAFTYRADTGLTAVTADNVEVRLGDGVDLDYKLAVWQALLAEAERRDQSVSLVDLRFGDRPYVK